MLPPVFNPSRSTLLIGKLSLLGLLAGLGACSNFDSLRSPVFTGSTNQQQIITGSASPLGNAYVGTQTASVEGTNLPPPAGASSAYAPPPAYASAAPQPYTPPSAYAAPPAAQPRYMQTASAPPVQRGAPPATLGEQAMRVPANNGGHQAGGSHLVQSGDTAWNISQRYGISVDQLAAANGGSTNIRLGQRLAIPGAPGSHPNAAQPAESGVQLASLNPREVPVATPPAPMPQVPAAAAVEPQNTATETQVAFAPQTGTAGSLAPAAPQPSVAADAGGFRWPVRGRIISGFGKKPNGERNDGINLAVPEGTSVKAAEDGTVIYAGNELKSYGNLVLIRHNNGWVSAYAHNSALQVKRGDSVKRGQVIALSGMSGGVTTPQVHFELRKDATPVDPLQHLTES